MKSSIVARLKIGVNWKINTPKSATFHILNVSNQSKPTAHLSTFVFADTRGQRKKTKKLKSLPSHLKFEKSVNFKEKYTKIGYMVLYLLSTTEPYNLL